MAFQRQGSELASTASMGADSGDNRNTSNPPPVVLVAKILACNTFVSLAHRPSTPSRCSKSGKASNVWCETSPWLVRTSILAALRGCTGSMAMASSGSGY